MHARRLVPCLLTLATLSPVAWASATSTQDLATLQGTWQLVYGQRDGVRVPPDQLSQTTIEFQGDTFRFPGAYDIGTSQGGTITVDADTIPRRMNSYASAAGGARAGEESLGIYRIEGDVYTVDFARPGDPRPTDFTAAAGSGRLLQIWVRQR